MYRVCIWFVKDKPKDDVNKLLVRMSGFSLAIVIMYYISHNIKVILIDISKIKLSTDIEVKSTFFVKNLKNIDDFNM